MARTLTGLFDTRRDAEMAVERLVQEQGVERTDIFIEAASSENTAGVAADGADVESGHGGEKGDTQPKLAGQIKVSVDLNDDAAVAKVKGAFREFGAQAA